MEKNPLDLEAQPIPDGTVVAGLDCGYVSDWTERKSNFEVIVGSSMPEDGSARYLGFVHGFDRKSLRRFVDMLDDQGIQPNPDITFLIYGDEKVRSLTEGSALASNKFSTGFLSPCELQCSTTTAFHSCGFWAPVFRTLATSAIDELFGAFDAYLKGARLSGAAGPDCRCDN